MNDVAPPLTLRRVCKSFDDVDAVVDVDLDLGAGELLALVGPSGCGKSTLLRSIAGLLAIDGGTIDLGGSIVDDGSAHLPPERRSTGLVFQEHALFPHLNVHDNVCFGLRDGTRAEIEVRAEEMLALVSMPDHASRFPHELSGGERQRVALARALAPKPALMLFDEPFASLDQNLRVKLRQDVLNALRATGTPAIFVTHDQDEALALGDRVAVMRNGRIRQIDTPGRVFHSPVDEFVGAFMGNASFLPIAVGANGMGQTVLGAIDVAGHAELSVRAMVRPDDLTFRSAADGPDEVIALEYHGSGWLVTARVRDGSEVLASRSHLEAPTIGERGAVELVPGHRPIAVSRVAD